MRDVSDRIISFDILRVASIMYIIGFWHLDDYLKPANIFNSPFTSTMALCALNIFIYISGFLLFAKYGTIATIKDAKYFLVKRIMRLYPLYALALLLFYLTSLYDYKGFLCALFFCNIFITLNLKTLWFISLIFVYYLLIPVMSYNYSVKRTLIICTIIFTVTVTLHEHFSFLGRQLIEERLLLFLPSFILGMFSAKHSSFLKIIKNKIVASIGFAFFLATVYEIHFIGNSWSKYLNFTMYLSISPLVVISEYLAPKINQQMIIKLSYASFCMYLFHRIIYWLILKVYYPQTNLLIIAYLTCAGLPVIYLTSKYIQSKYNSYIL